MELALWPYALHQATHLRNCLPDKEDASSPLERFSKTSVTPKLKENHAFGCPVFSLQSRLAGGRGGVTKWKPWAQLGINLGPSPRHVGSVPLLLNLQTLMVSPHFHLSYDDFFETVCPTAGNTPLYSNFQALTGLHKHENPVRDPKSTPPNRVERPEAIIIWDAPDLPRE